MFAKKSLPYITPIAALLTMASVASATQCYTHTPFTAGTQLVGPVYCIYPTTGQTIVESYFDAPAHGIHIYLRNGWHSTAFAFDVNTNELVGCHIWPGVTATFNWQQFYSTNSPACPTAQAVAFDVYGY